MREISTPPLAVQTGRRLLLAGLAHDPALAVIRAWNTAVLARAAAQEAQT